MWFNVMLFHAEYSTNIPDKNFRKSGKSRWQVEKVIP